jgi:predicted  nucleic acid-binding Zn-ribbon protein
MTNEFLPLLFSSLIGALIFIVALALNKIWSLEKSLIFRVKEFRSDYKSLEQQIDQLNDNTVAIKESHNALVESLNSTAVEDTADEMSEKIKLLTKSLDAFIDQHNILQDRVILSQDMISALKNKVATLTRKSATLQGALTKMKKASEKNS